MTEAKLPRPLPKRGPTRGEAFYAAAMAKYEFSPTETQLLIECARMLDNVDVLQAYVERDGEVTLGSAGQPRAHPALTELRGCRLALGRLLAQLDLPAEGEGLLSPETVRGRRAATARWSTAHRSATAVSDAARRAAMARWHPPSKDAADGA